MVFSLTTHQIWCIVKHKVILQRGENQMEDEKEEMTEFNGFLQATWKQIEKITMPEELEAFKTWFYETYIK